MSGLPQLMFALTLLVIGGACVAFNATIFYVAVVRKERAASSVMPIVGGPIAAVGIALLPFPGSWKWAWVPLVLDWGGLPIFLSAWYEKRTR